MQKIYGVHDPLFYLTYYLWLDTWMQHEILAEHSYRVSRNAVKIARKAGFNEFDVVITHYAGLLHDIGKLELPEKEIKRHPKLGAERVLDYRGLCVLFPYREEELVAVASAIRYHHERYDGDGHYKAPRDEIPLPSFVIRIADWHDWRKHECKWDGHKIRREMEPQSGTNFHPDLLKLFMDQS